MKFITTKSNDQMILRIALAFVLLTVSLKGQSSDLKDVPLDFYGKVVDQDGRPIPGASVNLAIVTTSFDPYNTKSTETIISGKNGSFGLDGKSGLAIEIYVSKKGYYSPESEQKTWTPTLPGSLALPTVRNPFIFHLRRMGKCDPLKPIKWDPLPLKIDGTINQVNLLTGNVDQFGQITVQFSADFKNVGEHGRFNWKTILTIKGGGITQRPDAFAFIAPTTGYRESTTFDFPVSLGNKWSDGIEQDCFIKLPNGKYLRGVIKIDPGNAQDPRPFCDFDGYLNPSGSNNLEWDPEKVAR